MKNREEEVADAHSNTFDWLFRSSSDNKQNNLRDQFTTWLQTDKLGSIYWGELAPSPKTCGVLTNIQLRVNQVPENRP